MLNFTREERHVLITLGLIFLIGTTFHYTLKKQPRLWDLINFVNSEKIYNQVDVNRATYEELIRIPYVGPVTAKRIIAFRQEKGPFTDTEQLKNIYGIGESRYKTIVKFLTVLPQKR